MVRRAHADVAIRCTDLSIAHAARGAASHRVVDGVSFTLDHGGMLAIMGPTGSGKSSLAALIAGAEDAGVEIVGGSAVVEGIDIRRGGRALRELTYLTGYLPQGAGAALPARLTIAEVIAEPITRRDRRVNGRALAVRIASLLDEMGLPLGAAAKYPYELSAGMRQRVALARSLVLQPKILIADEPFSNMDVRVRAIARDAIGRRRAEYGMTAVLVTNEADTVREIDAAVLVLHAGHAVAYGRRAADLLWTPGGPTARRPIAS